MRPSGGVSDAQLKFAGDEAEAAVVEGPVAGAEKCWASFANGFGDEVFRESARNLCGDRAAEHLEKIAQTLLSVFEGSGAVEEQGVSDFEAMAFEQGGILGDAGVVPRIRKGLSWRKILPSAAESRH